MFCRLKLGTLDCNNMRVGAVVVFLQKSLQIKHYHESVKKIGKLILAGGNQLYDNLVGVLRVLTP